MSRCRGALLLFTVGTLLLLGAFLFLRLYHLSTSLDFMADMGRDHYVLWKWSSTHKPPILGPGNSLLPINQSPIFYYLLFPIFILSGQSAYTSVISVLILYGTFIVGGTIVFRSSRWWLRLFLTFSALLTMQPEFIKQLRNPWNPSFVAPFLTIGILSLVLPSESFRKLRICMFWVCLFAALGFSYSVLPLAIFLMVTACVKWRAQVRLMLVAVVGSIASVFGPMLFFEVRHGFFFTRRLLLDHTLTAQKKFLFFGNVREIFYIFLGQRQLISVLFLSLLLLGSMLYTLKLVQKTKLDCFHIDIGLLLVVTLIAMSIAPFSIIPHYTFGALILLLLFIASMRRIWLALTLIVLAAIWIPPITRGEYWQPARRTITKLEECAQRVCKEEKSPFYVALQAWYPYHYAPDYLFFLNKHGCKAYDISNDPGQANSMAVVADQATFEFGKTTFNELTLFGPALLRKTYTCDATIHIYMLERRTQ